jgi:hypothetical protein
MRTMREVRDGDIYGDIHGNIVEIFMEMVVPISYIGNLVMNTSILYL